MGFLHWGAGERPSPWKRVSLADTKWAPEGALKPCLKEQKTGKSVYHQATRSPHCGTSYTIPYCVLRTAASTLGPEPQAPAPRARQQAPRARRGAKQSLTSVCGWKPARTVCCGVCLFCTARAKVKCRDDQGQIQDVDF